MTCLSKELRQKDGFYTLQEVSQQLGVSYSVLGRLSRFKQIPKATHIYHGSKQRYYSKDDVNAIVQRLSTSQNPRQVAGLLTMTQVARLLGISMSTIRDYIKGKVLPPPNRSSGPARKYYHDTQIPEFRRLLAEHQAKPVSRTDWYNVILESGYYTVSQASRELGIPLVTMQDWLAHRGLPAPTHLCKGMKVYAADDLPRLKQYMVDNGYRPNYRVRTRRLDERKRL